MNLTLCLTHDCNLACSYCYAGPKRRASMSQSTAHKAVDFMFAYPAAKYQLGFFGGEPLMEWDMIVESIAYAESAAAKHGVQLRKTVTTNATLLTKEKMEWLVEHGFWLGLSIDGNRAMHDITRPRRGGGSSFDACMAGLDAALAHSGYFEVIVVPDPANVKHLADSVRFLADDKKVERISINPNFYTTWDGAALDEWRKAFISIGEFYLERYRAGRTVMINFIDGKIITRLKNGFSECDLCNFGEKEIAVAPSGNIYPCERLVSDDANAEMCIGNIERGFDSVKRAGILKRRGNVNKDCSTCAIKGRCMNWCCCINYATTGAIDQTDGVVCFHERLAVEVADSAAEKLYGESNPAFLSKFYYD